jgi:iron complex transport system substrate-binding protein
MIVRKGPSGSMRIVSLLPSLTEICFTLGLGHQLVAVTHECDFPGRARSIPHITRSILPPANRDSAEIDRQVKAALAEGKALYELDRERLARLQPELILTQALCHVCAVSVDDVRGIAAELEPIPEVVSIEPTTLTEVIQSISTIGKLTDRVVTARAVVDALQRRIELIREHVHRTKHQHRVVCLEWLDPPMVAGHWVPEMVQIAGGIDPLGEAGTPSFEVSWQDVIDSEPDTIVLMPCGFDLTDTVQETARIVETGSRIPVEIDQTPAVRDGHVYAVDGSAFFSRPGPRLVSGVELLTGILHAELAASHTPPGVVEPVQLVPAGVRG